MDVNQPQTLLGGLSPAQFMKRYWQKKPLLVRQAIPCSTPLVSRADLFAMAADESVESRLITQSGGWRLRRGPLTRRSLPPLNEREWTLLVQGVDLHDDAVHGLMQQFRFVPDARLDDIMISFATDGGGVGPHFDSYDVFLLQAHGQRRWRIGRQKNLRLVDGLPLKILAEFEPEEEHVLEPGDMLYLPPRWAHDGVALGECMTYSIGFRQPASGEVAQELLGRLAEEARELVGDAAYRDPSQPAVSAPGEVPAAMRDFARDALARALEDPGLLAMLMGEWLTEPKPSVWFEPPTGLVGPLQGVRLDRRTRMLYDEDHVFINGEGFSASGRDARTMRLLADQRRLDAKGVKALSAGARSLLQQWCDAGWIHAE
ncbi:cupin domain-containing protein [Ottowia sp. GY511]|uniref:JmjC domain-containing protein n=1 Tax=Ottowia flava TaxID=2675430 RepID=A0ABW4KX66_9BURK|nr:cupin domain-containing protein [Ottowia sp. GY511]TXK33486.1 cupin domain-containing protein [Ottowia sp. GY511]